MTSRERILTALDHQEPDRVPLTFADHSWAESVGIDPADPCGWVDYWLNRGVDATLSIGLDSSPHPEVKTRVYQDQWPGETRPVTIKRYETPGGDLRLVARSMPWPDRKASPLSAAADQYDPDDLPLMSDSNVPRLIEFPVETEADLEPLRCILGGSTDQQIADLHRRAASAKQDADGRGIVLEGSAGGGAEFVYWLMRWEKMVYALQDTPDLITGLMAIIREWTLRQLEILLSVGVLDVVRRRAWYETPRYWPLDAHARHIVPMVRQECALAKQAGVKYVYHGMTTDAMAVVDRWAEMGVDVVWGINPGEDVVDLAEIKRRTQGQVALWGGMDSHRLLFSGTREEIAETTEFTIQTLGPGGGFVLQPDYLFSDTRPDAVQTVIDVWRRVGEYPLASA